MYEKRTYFRKPLNLPVTCYVEGRKFDALARDISRGGIFLKIIDPQAVPMSAIVGLTFPTQARKNTTFLFGKVTRMHEGPDEGIGLEWDKAVSGGDPVDLEQFINKMFGISNPRIVKENAPRGDRNVFKFDTQPNRDAVPVQPRGTSGKPGRKASTRPQEKEDGEYTGVSCYIKGRMEENMLRHPALITRLGPRSALAHTPLKYDPRQMYADLIFSIPTKDGPAEIVCRSEARQIGPEEPGTVAFKFLSVEEGQSRGILRRYLSWLQIHQNDEQH